MTLIFFLRTLLMLMLAGVILSGLIAIAYVIGRSRAARGSTKGKPARRELPPDAGVRNLLLEGRLDEATQVYQRFTGVDEFTARAEVSQLQRELRLSGEAGAEIVSLLREGQKAAAIERYQQMYGASLEDALEAVESIERRR